MSMSVVGPLMAVLSMVAAVVGAFVGVKFTAQSAQATAQATQQIVNGLATSIAVLQVEVKHLSDGLAAANDQVEQLSGTVAALQRDLTRAVLQ